MRRILVVSFTSDQKYTGGLQCSKRNLESIKAIFGENNVINYVIRPYDRKQRIWTKLKRVYDIFCGFMGGLDNQRMAEIVDIIRKEKVTDLFVDSSLLGLLSKTVKKRFPNVKVTTFFHNYEKGFVNDAVIGAKDYFHLYWILLTAINEKCAIKYSDKIISLNERDASAIRNEYGRYPDKLIPITLKSPVLKVDETVLSDNHEALFLGSYFFGNVQGLKWFCDEVLPKIDIHLTIVGASMDRFANDIVINDKITICNDVPDVVPYFEAADFVILPIISGSGMKVKTAESLMNGKYIIGTDEAFRGYEITDEVGKRCNDASEFVAAINGLSLPNKFNKPSRDLFEKKYSFQASLSAFKDILS